MGKSHQSSLAEPWWQNDELTEILDQGLEPMIAEMTAYFPALPTALLSTQRRFQLLQTFAVVKGNVSGLANQTDRCRWLPLARQWGAGCAAWISYRS